MEADNNVVEFSDDLSHRHGVNRTKQAEKYVVSCHVYILVGRFPECDITVVMRPGRVVL